MDQSAHLQFSPATFDRAGSGVIQGLFTFGLFLLLYIVWLLPDVIVYVPFLLVGLVGAYVVFHYPLLNLSVVLSLFVLIVDFEEGIQIREVFYGLYYLSFLTHWFVTRLFIRRQVVFQRFEDKILIVFLFLITISLFVTLLFDGTLSAARGEWISLSLLAFYFPIREAITEYRHGLMVILIVIAWIGFFVLIRNVFMYREILLSATYAYQITHGRAVTNEGLLLVPAMLALVFYLFSDGLTARASLLIAFLFFLAGLILTQSRGYWVAFLIGGGFLFLLVPRKYKVKLLSTGFLAGGLILGLGIIFLGDFVLIVVSGLLDRFLSIGSASFADISLINRFLESKAVLAKIIQNPILGYGMGVPYSVYDITYELTVTKSFVHNGYIALWYKFGLWGLSMILLFFGFVMYRAYAVFRFDSGVTIARVCCLGVLACFAAFAVSANTSNPFYNNDLMFIYALLAGIAGGCYTLSCNRLTK